MPVVEGVDRIREAFESVRAEHRAALMPYLVAGFPDREGSLEVARAYLEVGADLVEVGVPFSDPLADGPVIHAAASQALEGGATMETAMRVVAELGTGVPAVLMCYTNMILAKGPERFADECRDAGVAGVIVPDLPHGQAPDIEHAIRDRGMASIPLVAPNTTPERLAAICSTAEGFVYVVSSIGTTGVREGVPEGLTELVASVRELASVPVAVGFGVGSPESAAAVGTVADGVIIGSRLVRIVAEAGSGRAAAGELAEFLGSVRAALDRQGSAV